MTHPLAFPLYVPGDPIRLGPNTQLNSYEDIIQYRNGVFIEGVVLSVTQTNIDVILSRFPYKPRVPVARVLPYAPTLIEPVPGDKTTEQQRILSDLVKKGYAPVFYESRVLSHRVYELEKQLKAVKKPKKVAKGSGFFFWRK